MKVPRENLMSDAQAIGFRPEVLEKVIQLLNLLEGFNSHSFLRGRWALKGGTALNLFYFDVPRLSVDLDINYIGAVDRDVMMTERPKVEKALKAVCLREGMQITRMPDDFAGGKWRLRYDSSISEYGNLEVDLNFMYRLPLWPITARDATIGTAKANQIPVLDLHELTAGKLAALFSRQASRDLFDAYLLLTRENLDPQKLRLGFVVYGAMNRKDWRTARIQDVSYDLRELNNQLVPVIRGGFLDGKKTSDWARSMLDECQQALEIVLPLKTEEMEFLDQILDHGQVKPELLTSDEDMMNRIASHPLLQWKALNVKKHKGI